MACDDAVGVEVMEACRRAGLRMSEMIGVVGVDNDELLCNLGDPPMSSVVVNWPRAGVRGGGSAGQPSNAHAESGGPLDQGLPDLCDGTAFHGFCGGSPAKLSKSASNSSVNMPAAGSRWTKWRRGRIVATFIGEVVSEIQRTFGSGGNPLAADGPDCAVAGRDGLAGGANCRPVGIHRPAAFRPIFSRREADQSDELSEAAWALPRFAKWRFFSANWRCPGKRASVTICRIARTCQTSQPTNSTTKNMKTTNRPFWAVPVMITALLASLQMSLHAGGAVLQHRWGFTNDFTDSVGGATASGDVIPGSGDILPTASGAAWSRWTAFSSLTCHPT